MEDFLGYPGWPSVVMMDLNGGMVMQRGQSVCCGVRRPSRPSLAREMEGTRSQGMQAALGLEKAREQILPEACREECSPAHTLIFVSKTHLGL